MARPQQTPVAMEAVRARLIELALGLALGEGLENLSFRRLAEVAGMSHTLPYRYFDSKEALVIALRVACTRRFDDFVRAREQPGATGLDQVRNIAASYVEFVRRNPGEYQIIFSMQSPAPDLYPELMAARRNLFEHAVDILHRTIEQGSLAGDARELAHLLWASLHGLMTLHVAGQLIHGRTLDELVEPLVSRMISGTNDVAGKRRVTSIATAHRVRR